MKIGNGFRIIDLHGECGRGLVPELRLQIQSDVLNAVRAADIAAPHHQTIHEHLQLMAAGRRAVVVIEHADGKRIRRIGKTRGVGYCFAQRRKISGGRVRIRGKVHHQLADRAVHDHGVVGNLKHLLQLLSHGNLVTERIKTGQG